jgi:AcrR family transcriptional regulator
MSRISPGERGSGRPVTNPDRDTRTLLLNAATELFAECGVAATSFATIARRAGVTPAMVHYHFDSREELLDAVVDDRILPLISAVWSPVKAGENPQELLRGVVQRLLEQISKTPWVPSTWMREVLNEGGLLRGRILKRLPIDKVRMVAAALAKGQQSNTINPDIDPLLLVFSALGLVMLHMATIQMWAEIFHRPPVSIARMGRHITGLLLHGIQPRDATGTVRTGRKRPQRRSR